MNVKEGCSHYMPNHNLLKLITNASEARGDWFFRVKYSVRHEGGWEGLRSAPRLQLSWLEGALSLWQEAER